MDDLDPLETCKKIVGSTIVGIAINADDETVTISTTNGILEFEGDSLEMYVEFTDLDS